MHQKGKFEYIVPQTILARFGPPQPLRTMPKNLCANLRGASLSLSLYLTIASEKSFHKSFSKKVFTQIIFTCTPHLLDCGFWVNSPISKLWFNIPHCQGQTCALSKGVKVLKSVICHPFVALLYAFACGKARWIRSKIGKLVKIKTDHLKSYVREALVQKKRLKKQTLSALGDPPP